MTGDQVKAIEDAQANPHRLTEWEQEFVAGLAKRSKDTELSEKQDTILIRIFRKLQWD